MLFNDKLIFIHIGKTGGISCSRFLLENLRPTVYNCHQTAEAEIAQLPTANRPPIVALENTHRHWTLEQSLEFIKQFNGKNLNDFKLVVAVIRNPVTLEFSFYNHMRKKHVREQRGSKSQVIFDLSDGPFSEFVKHAGYHVPGLTQDDFVRVNGEIPERVKLVKFESIDPDFVDVVSPYLHAKANNKIAKTNSTGYQRTAHTTLKENLTDVALEAIYQKHRYMFDCGYYSIDEPIK